MDKIYPRSTQLLQIYPFYKLPKLTGRFRRDLSSLVLLTKTASSTIGRALNLEFATLRR